MSAVVHPRWARVVGAVWLLAAVALAVAAAVVVVDQHRLGWEVVAVLPAGALGWWWWHRELAVDEHGIAQCVGWRRTRLLWDVVEGVELPDPGHPTDAVRVRLAGRDPVVLRAGWGLSHRQRCELSAAVADHGHDAGA